MIKKENYKQNKFIGNDTNNWGVHDNNNDAGDDERISNDAYNEENNDTHD